MMPMATCAKRFKCFLRRGHLSDGPVGAKALREGSCQQRAVHADIVRNQDTDTRAKLARRWRRWHWRGRRGHGTLGQLDAKCRAGVVG
jgi:hypothetical protein